MGRGDRFRVPLPRSDQVPVTMAFATLLELGQGSCPHVPLPRSDQVPVTMAFATLLELGQGSCPHVPLPQSAQVPVTIALATSLRLGQGSCPHVPLSPCPSFTRRMGLVVLLRSRRVRFCLPCIGRVILLLVLFRIRILCSRQMGFLGMRKMDYLP